MLRCVRQGGEECKVSLALGHSHQLCWLSFTAFNLFVSSFHAYSSQSYCMEWMSATAGCSTDPGSKQLQSLRQKPMPDRWMCTLRVGLAIGIGAGWECHSLWCQVWGRLEDELPCFAATIAAGAQDSRTLHHPLHRDGPHHGGIALPLRARCQVRVWRGQLYRFTVMFVWLSGLLRRGCCRPWRERVCQLCCTIITPSTRCPALPLPQS